VDKEGSNIDINKVSNSLKSILVIGGVIFAIAGFYYTSLFGQKAFVEEQEVRAKADEALYNRITKTTNRNAEWNIKQDNTTNELREEIIQLRINEAIYEEREKFIEYRISISEKAIERLQKRNSDE